MQPQQVRRRAQGWRTARDDGDAWWLRYCRRCCRGGRISDEHLWLVELHSGGVMRWLLLWMLLLLVLLYWWRMMMRVLRFAPQRRETDLFDDVEALRVRMGQRCGGCS
jgi:hypothetical protein